MRVPVDEGVLDFEYGAPGEYTYSPCSRCGVLAISPVPDDAILAEAYPADYHAYKPHSSAFAATLKKRYWRGLAQSIVARVGTSARILDVGCARGDLLSALREAGVRDVVGVEYSKGAARLVRERGFEVVEGELEDVAEELGPFDAITMINMIEHVYSPTETMIRAAKLLADGGVVIGETPNHDAWDKRWFGRFWGGYHTPRHITIFHEPSLGMLAERSGLRLLECGNIIQPAHWALSVQNLMRAKEVGPRVEHGRSCLFPWLLLAAAPLNVLQALVAKTSSVAFVMDKGRR